MHNPKTKSMIDGGGFTCAEVIVKRKHYFHTILSASHLQWRQIEAIYRNACKVVEKQNLIVMLGHNCSERIIRTIRSGVDCSTADCSTAKNILDFVERLDITDAQRHQMRVVLLAFIRRCEAEGPNPEKKVVKPNQFLSSETPSVTHVNDETLAKGVDDWITDYPDERTQENRDRWSERAESKSFPGISTLRLHVLQQELLELEAIKEALTDRIISNLGKTTHISNGNITAEYQFRTTISKRIGDIINELEGKK